MYNLKKIRPMLKITNLTKSFGKYKAVNQVSLEVTKPGLYIFVGANGSGKTTLFNLINGFILPDSGTISLNKITQPDKIRSVSGISTEPFITEPSLNVAEIVDIAKRMKGAKNGEAEKWLDFWQLNNAKTKSFKTLSTGLKKRLSLALSLLGTADSLFWDEPFNGLDPLGIELLNKVIERLCSEKKYLFLSTHLLNEILPQALCYFVMHEGKLIGCIPGDAQNAKEKIIHLLKEKECLPLN